MNRCLLAVAALLMAGFDRTEPVPSPRCVTVHKKDDRALFEDLEKSARILVTSQSGIGKLTFAAAKDSHLPEQVTIRLAYGQLGKFSKLEHLKLTTSRWQVRGSSSNSGKLPFFLPDEQGVFEADDTKPAGWFDIRIVTVDDDLEIRLPARLLLHEQKLEVEWIDFYRN